MPVCVRQVENVMRMPILGARASLKQTHREVILRHMLIKSSVQTSLNSHPRPHVCVEAEHRQQVGTSMVWKQAGTVP